MTPGGRSSPRREHAVGLPQTLRIGVTGPIGCGKSTIAGWLAESGAVVIDADVVAREVVEPDEPALAAVAVAFGPTVLRPDGSLDRAALAARVFGDPPALRALEAIIRPAVRLRIEARLAAAEQERARVVVLEAIGLVEGGYAPDCHEVWLVTCDPEAQRSRLRGRGVTAADAEGRIAAQARTLPGMRGAATRIIDTTGSMDVARGAVERALAEALANHEGRAEGSARP